MTQNANAEYLTFFLLVLTRLEKIQSGFIYNQILLTGVMAASAYIMSMKTRYSLTLRKDTLTLLLPPKHQHYPNLLHGIGLMPHQCNVDRGIMAVFFF